MRGGQGICVSLAKRQVGTQTAGTNKSIKANLPRFCNSFSIEDSTERKEPWIWHMSHYGFVRAQKWLSVCQDGIWTPDTRHMLVHTVCRCSSKHFGHICIGKQTVVIYSQNPNTGIFCDDRMCHHKSHFPSQGPSLKINADVMSQCYMCEETVQDIMGICGKKVALVSHCAWRKSQINPWLRINTSLKHFWLLQKKAIPAKTAGIIN